MINNKPKSFSHLMSLLNKRLAINTSEAEPYETRLGMVLIIAYIGFYFFNFFYASTGGNENLTLRIIICIFGLICIFHKNLPQFIKKHYNYLFHFILCFSFPYFFSFMLFHNQDSNIWQVNGLVGFILLSFFVDWITFILLSVIGVLAAYLSASIIEQNFFFDRELITVFLSYSPPVIYFLIFSQKRNSIKDIQTQYQKRLETLNISLEQRVSERTAHLEKALLAKTEFLNNMSHEIRTPIQGFTAISEGLSEHWDGLDGNHRKSLAKQISQNARRLSTLVGSLLDLSRVNDSKILLSFNSINLNQLIIDMIDECKTLYQSDKDLNFIFESGKEIFISADQERINQALRNILINAIKFTCDKGHVIIIELTESTILYENGKKIDAAHIAIIDEGVGVPEAELEQIFLPAVQSSRTQTKAGGTGLGLAITSEIVKAHHGKIWAENNKTSGTKINLLLPIAQPNEIKINKKQKASKSNSSTGSPTILMIDDEVACLTSIELILRSTNYKLIKAKGGQEALEILSHNHNIDLVLLDLMMPDMYGLNVLEKIKALPEIANIPVILQTGTSDAVEIDKAYKLGISNHIQKPYNKHIVIEAIASILEQNHS